METIGIQITIQYDMASQNEVAVRRLQTATPKVHMSSDSREVKKTMLHSGGSASYAIITMARLKHGFGSGTGEMGTVRATVTCASLL